MSHRNRWETEVRGATLKDIHNAIDIATHGFFGHYIALNEDYSYSMDVRSEMIQTRDGGCSVIYSTPEYVATVVVTW